ncbi:ORF250 [White spot syndrome virus]|uniref:ORF250 n=1 Tax=White spot syndrome virus TaxID=342409 RepID=A0A2D3I5S0_9VIRU|nr:ORF250 [White spot syndrome virus]
MGTIQDGQLSRTGGTDSNSIPIVSVPNNNNNIKKEHQPILLLLHLLHSPSLVGEPSAATQCIDWMTSAEIAMKLAITISTLMIERGKEFAH